MANPLSGFKKISSTPHMTVLRHPEGHEIRVAHSGLGEGLKKQLEAMPTHLADGTPMASEMPTGEDTPEKIVADAESAPAVASPPEQSLAGKAGKYIGDVGKQGLADAFQAVKTVGEPVVNAGKDFVSGLAGGEQQPQAQQAQGKTAQTPADYHYDIPQKEALPPAPAYESPYEAEALAAKNQAIASEKLQKWTQGHMDAIDALTGQVTKELMDGKIDPNKYMNEMGAGQKVTSALGLILGGLSGGMNGSGKNPAMEFLNQQIERNVQGQAQSLGVKQNLLSALHQQYGNMKDAVDMSRAVNTDYYAAQMAQAAAKIQDPMQKQRMFMAMQQMMQQSQGLKAGVAQRQGYQSAKKEGGVPPQLLIDWNPMMGPKEKEDAGKELVAKQQLSKLRRAVQESFDDLSGKTLAGHLSPGDRASAMNAYSGPLATLAEHRFNLSEAENQIRALLPEGLESSQTRKNKQHRLDTFFDSLVQTPILDAYNIPADNFGPAPVQNQNVSKSYGQAR